jgi:NTE family protein
MSKALILSGGSIKGAWQAGAVKAIFDKGFTFDAIHGVSVGSLNGSFICQEAAKQMQSGPNLDWSQLGESLVQFWKENIKNPGNIAKERKWYQTVVAVMRNRYNGLVDTTPLQDLVKRTINPAILQQSPIKLTVGAVNLASGNNEFPGPGDPNFIDYLIASTAIPIIMPVQFIAGNKNRPYLDGGIRDVAPIGKAIDAGADDIVCVLCQSRETTATFDPGNLMALADRVMEIVVNEIVNNDIKRAEDVNKQLAAGNDLQGKKQVKITIIRPNQPIGLDLSKFSEKEILDTINSGYSTASSLLNL